MSEIWTATERTNDNGDEYILFDVLDETTGTTRQERQFASALPLMFGLGGYPPVMGQVIAMKELPWRFRMHKNGQIYLDGPSVGIPNYHPIEKEPT